MKIGIFGGNGFVGSAIARKAVARGWSVVSFSRSGTPFATPAGHTPAWAEEVRRFLSNPLFSSALADHRTIPSFAKGGMEKRFCLRPADVRGRLGIVRRARLDSGDSPGNRLQGARAGSTPFGAESDRRECYRLPGESSGAADRSIVRADQSRLGLVAFSASHKTEM